MEPQDLPLTASSPGGQIAYRRLLALSFLEKFFISTTQTIHSLYPTTIQPIPARDLDALGEIERDLSHGTQEFESSEAEGDAVGKSVVHLSAVAQCTGEAVYVDDMPKIQGELYGGLVVSSVGHAEIL